MAIFSRVFCRWRRRAKGMAASSSASTCPFQKYSQSRAEDADASGSAFPLAGGGLVSDGITTQLYHKNDAAKTRIHRFFSLGERHQSQQWNISNKSWKCWDLFLWWLCWHFYNIHSFHGFI
jgi:hypothetical protein